MFLDNNMIKLEICNKKMDGNFKYLKIKQSITK